MLSPLQEAINIIMKEGGILAGIIVAFDRLEKTPSTTETNPRSSAVGNVRKQYGAVVSALERYH